MEPSEGVFKRKAFDSQKLLAYGFTQEGGAFFYSAPLMQGQFTLHVSVKEGEACTEVRDTDGEIFPLYRVAEAGGAFVGQMRSEAEEIFRQIAKSCCFSEIWKYSQTKEVIAYALKEYGDREEYLWEKFPDCAILRRKDNRKWYAAILTVAAKKLGLKGEGNVEVVDLRGEAEEIAREVDGKLFFAAYHMNKKHWFTVVLDGSLPMLELEQRIDKSYLLAKK